jgi:hypothetical protein
MRLGKRLFRKQPRKLARELENHNGG